MKILMAVLLLLCSGCEFKRQSLDRDRITEETVTLRQRVCISEDEIDKWNLLYGDSMDNEYAQALAVCFYHDYGHNITDKLSDFSLVLAGKSLDQCLLTARNQYKYQLADARRSDVERLREYYRCRNIIVSSEPGRIVPCEFEDLVLKKETEQRQEIWERYRTIGGGNGFYEVNINRYWQCTTFVWARFYEVYGYDSGAVGDGCFHAAETVRAHPTRFEISSLPQPGAVFSMWISDYSHAGHTGFIEAVEGEYIWISDANYDGKGTIRFNYKMKLADFVKWYPGTFYAVPIRF
ncbi:MAG: CHAP domain-containing protein [Erysipelotrichaceae bacterium]|nr:CHAP domain-containing protein [Erysipelotrichaceae bacterium]